MGVTSVIIFGVLLAGSFASPALQPSDVDITEFLYHTDPTARIVGGTQAAENSVRYMVALTQGTWIRSLVCGGSLVTTRTVLTAAHCIAAVVSGGNLASSVLGTVGTNRWASGGTSYSMSRHVIHQNYVSSTIKNDIGVLITASNVALTNMVQTVALSFDWVGAGVMTRANGWGRVVTGGAISATLLELTKPTIDGQVCVTEVPRVAATLNMRPPPVDPNVEICTYHSPGRGMCNGDSGSALVRTSNWQQIGLVSWGVPCARGAPDMFVRVSAYRDWLNQNIV